MARATGPARPLRRPKSMPSVSAILVRANRAAAPLLFGVLAVMAFLLATGARDKAFWHDEVYTVLAAALPLPSLWLASLDGVDLSPPLNTVVTHFVQAAGGVGPVVTRLPAMTGFLVAAALLFVMATRRANVVVGLSVMLALASTTAWRFALEARGYALTVGLFAVVLYCWSEAAAGRRPRLHWTALAIAMAAGVWTHYYFVLAALPVLAGELARQARAGRLDKCAWAAMAGAVLAVLPLWPLVNAAAAQRATFWARPRLPNVVGVYSYLQADFALPRLLLAALALLAIVETLRRVRARSNSGLPHAVAMAGLPHAVAMPRRLPLHEIVAGLACIVLPAACAGLGHVLGVFDPRYATFSCAGLALALPLAAWLLTPAVGAGDLLLAGALAAGFVRIGAAAFDPPWYQNPWLHRPLLEQQLAGSGPLVVAGGGDWLPLWFHAPEALRARVVYLADPEGQLRHDGNDSIDRGYLALARWSPVPVVPMAQWLASHQRFRLYSTQPGWTERSLADHGATLRELARESSAGGTLYEVVVAPRGAGH